MILTYEAIDTEGRRRRDTVEAHDVKEAVEHLHRRGLYVSRIKEAGRGSAGTPFSAKGTQSPCKGAKWADPLQGGCVPAQQKSSTRSTFRSWRPEMPLKTLVIFTRQLAMLLRSGSSVVPAVAAIGRQMTKPTHAAILKEIVVDLEEGLTLTEALRKHPRTFDPVYCAIVTAGEASATLPETFERLATIVRKRRVLRNQIIGALAYPAVLIAMSVHIVLALLLFVIPRFNDMFVQLAVDPPASTRFLLSVSRIISGHWIILTILAVGAAVTLVVMGTSARGRQWLVDIQLIVPVFGRLRSSLIQGQIFRTMGMLLESGVGVLDTFDLTRQATSNRRFRKLFDDLEEAVTAGGTLSTTFEASTLVEPYICQAIHTGEESGNLGGALSYSADLIEETNTELINTTMKLVEPIILIVLGFVVGSVAISLFLPLFDMTSAMR